MIAAFTFIPESVVAIMVAVIGTGGMLWAARWNAKRTDRKDARDDSAIFRGEVLDDNKALRVEIRALKADLQAAEKLIADKGKENDTLRLVNFKQEQQILMYEAQLKATSILTAEQLSARQSSL